jgi:ubiquinone/menaquinone biosynthesis C-methylase UbiE
MESLSTQIEREAAPMAHLEIHDTVVQVMGGLPRGRVLDVPAGEGALAARLIKSGFDVHCCDLYPQIFRLKGVEIKQGDMSATLPYNNNQFDYVTCLEGLEHIENPHQAIREFKRVLKPTGQLLISIPNIMNIEERMKWLLNGYTSHFKPLSRESIAKIKTEFGDMEEIAFHINPVPYSELRFVLEKNNFQIVKLYRDRPKGKLWLYYPIVAVIKLIALFTPPRKRRERWTEELQSNEILLGGNTLIVQAIKK